MKILWITNSIFPAPSKALGYTQPTGGGWMFGLGEQVASSLSVSLAIATVYPGSELKVFDIDNIKYYLLPIAKELYQRSLEKYWKIICTELNPDIIHIHGTEYTQGLACLRACPNFKYVVSIQGLVSIYARYYYGGMSTYEILRNLTLRDVVSGNTLFKGKRNFEKRGVFEKELISKLKNVIGRTSWDFAHVKAIKPSIEYHFCNESLRDGFYGAKKWDIDNKSDYTIFLSQAIHPFKGLHQVLKACYLLKEEFPTIKIRIAGQDIMRSGSFKERIRLSGYGAYIGRLIKKSGLGSQIFFTGVLSEADMITEYQNAHVFVCPSSIENSPNSLGEAQLLGLPSICAYVGGAANMIEDGHTGLLYRFEEIEMLAIHIKTIFLNNAIATKISNEAIKAAEIRHNRSVNLHQNLLIYNKVISNNTI